MFSKIFVALVALGIPLLVQGYGSGAPNEECSTMTPRHGVDPQRGAAPYDITLDKKTIRAGESVTVTIKSRSAETAFKGLMVEARVGDIPIGVFDVSHSRQHLQVLNCGSSRGNAVTHKKLTEPISEVKFNWTAPKSLSESVVFLVTMVQNGGVFWVGLKSPTLIVK